MWVRTTALIIAGIITSAAPAMAVNYEQAFNLCAAQPLLQAEALQPLIEDQLSRPHPPELDFLSKSQMINAVQYQEATECAAKILARPDAFPILAAQQFVSKGAWEFAWVAFNSICKRDYGDCIKEELGAYTAIITANESAGGWAPVNRLCSIALPADTDPVGLKKCIDAVGDMYPDDRIADYCGASIGWHSEKNPVAAGQHISRCLRANAQYDQGHQIFAHGTLRVCWPRDFGNGDKKHDLKIPAGLIFRDWGRDLKEIGAVPEPDGPPVDATIITTQAGVLRTSGRCVSLEADLVNYPLHSDQTNEPGPESVGKGPIVKTLSPGDHRLLVATELLSSDQKPEPNIVGFAQTEFHPIGPKD